MGTFIQIACLLYFILVVLNNSIYEADIKYKGVSCRWLCVLIADHKFEVQFFLISSRTDLGYYIKGDNNDANKPLFSSTIVIKK
jgi:hypothetical protein